MLNGKRASQTGGAKLAYGQIHANDFRTKTHPAVSSRLCHASPAQDPKIEDNQKIGDKALRDHEEKRYARAVALILPPRNVADFQKRRFEALFLLRRNVAGG
jgi:hypothetical protein